MAVIASQDVALRDGRVAKIRTPVEDDAPALLAYMHEVLRGSAYLVTEPDEFTTDEAGERAWIAENRAAEDALNVLAEVDGEVAGLLDFRVKAPRRRVLHRGDFGVSVRPGYRGLGVGSALIEAMLGWARAHPRIEKVCLAAMADNEEAVRLYRRLGFEEEGRCVRQNRLGPGRYVDDVLMYQFVK